MDFSHEIRELIYSPVGQDTVIDILLVLNKMTGWIVIIQPVIIVLFMLQA